MNTSPETGGRPTGPRVRADRLILFSVVFLLLVFLGGYLVLRRAAHFSWPYITNSVLLSVLFLTNAILVLTLLTLLMRNLVKALVERRRGILGSRFRTKLVFSLLLLWLVPSGIIFYAALHLIQRSVDRWFNEPMDRLTEASQQIADAYLDEHRARAASFAEEIARRLEADGLPDPPTPESMHRMLSGLLRDYHLDLLALDRVGGDRYLVLEPRLSNPGDLEEVPADQMRQAVEGRPLTWTSQFRGGLLVRAVYPVKVPGRARGSALVTAGIHVPRDLAKLAAAVVRSNEDYRQMRTQKGLIKRVYVLVFAFITLVVLFSVTWIGLYLARRITEPVQSLAQGTREISMGNLDYRVEVRAGDELGILVDSFNRMTADLRAGKETIERRNLELSRSNRELMERRRYIETLLQNLTAAVISLDAEGRITTINRAALRLLDLESRGDPIGSRLIDLVAPPGRTVVENILAGMEAGGRDGAIREVEIPVGGRTLTLAVSATLLRGDAGESLGGLLVVEDLTDLMRAQKIAAWREVARRLAHEIKNPLTPIQLSAERIRKKYGSRGADLDEIVEEGTASIIREVAALKNLVDEFSRFARLPAPEPKPTDLRGVIDSALSLFNGLHPQVTIEARCAPDLPSVNVDAEQLKRALVNILDNAVAAMEGQGRVTVEARWDAASRSVILEVADEGPGIRAEDRDRLFLPYFSTKKQGSGLGLAIVHRIVTDHMGRIRVEENHPRGARFVIELPVGRQA